MVALTKAELRLATPSGPRVGDLLSGSRPRVLTCVNHPSKGCWVHLRPGCLCTERNVIPEQAGGGHLSMWVPRPDSSLGTP